jgi:hypothetical protein
VRSGGGPWGLPGGGKSSRLVGDNCSGQPKGPQQKKAGARLRLGTSTASAVELLEAIVTAASRWSRNRTLQLNGNQLAHISTDALRVRDRQTNGLSLTPDCPRSRPTRGVRGNLLNVQW